MSARSPPPALVSPSPLTKVCLSVTNGTIYRVGLAGASGGYTREVTFSSLNHCLSVLPVATLQPSSVTGKSDLFVKV